MTEIQKDNTHRFKAIDFFCGGGGMTCGLRQAGIDEINNCLYYSAYKKLWEAIFALATETNKQVFVITYSNETFCRLSEMLTEHTEYQEALHLYSIENTKLKGYQSYKYTYEGLAEVCENDIEIRSVVL